MKKLCLLFLIFQAIVLPKTFASFPAASDSFTIHSLGHATLMVEYNNIIIHIDPSSAQANYDLLPKADLILITHGHGDHYDLGALNKIKKESTEMICTQAVSNLGTYAVTKTVLNNGDSIIIQGIEVKAVPAYNIVSGTFHPKGTGNGYILTLGKKRVYVAGDTENIPEMAGFGEIDIAFIPMNLPYTMTPEMAADAAKKIKPDILYIYHFGSSDTAKLRTLLSDQNMEIRMGKSVFHESAVKDGETTRALQNFDTEEFSFYPNPVRDFLTVKISNPNSLISFYNLKGQFLEKYQLQGNGSHQVDVGFLKSGMYVVKLDDQRNEMNKVLMKE
jgi:L-ascorbate metabolism protein UlaG (beta-lactamase superfamily)